MDQFLPNSKDKIYRMIDGKWHTITCKGSNVNVDNIVVPNIKHVIKIIQAIVNYITNVYKDSESDSRLLQNPPTNPKYAGSLLIGPKNDTTELILFDTYTTRRANVYIFLQYNYNTKKIRILAYGTDHINHSAICFGTSIEQISKQDLTNYIAKTFQNSLQNLLQQRSITPQLEHVLKNITSVQQFILTM